MPYYVYILRSESTGKTYVGQTNDIAHRIKQHNDPECKLTLYTKRNKGPWVLIHCEEFPTRSQAMHRERQLKSGQGREWIRANLLDQKAGDC